MNGLSKFLLGAVVIAVLACVWFLLTQKNKGSSCCSGNCAGCSEACGKRNEEKQD